MSTAVARAADGRILDLMFREHNSWLLGWLRSRSKFASNAEDIAADVFVRLTAMNDLGSIREPRAMMTTIANRLMIEIFRRRQLQNSYEAALAVLPEAIADSPERQLIVTEALREISKILSTMSAKARTAFLLSQIDGMKHTEIAKEVGVSVTMVRRYIAQGLLLFYEFHPDRS